MLDGTSPLGTRRNFVRSTAAVGSALALGGCLGGSGGGGEDPIKIGDLAPRTGASSIYGQAKYRAAKLIVQRQNENGGLLGRDIELIAEDSQSDIERYKNLTNKLILEDQVDFLTGAVNSSAREAIRPVLAENKQLSAYTTQYEGGVCDQYMFVTGPTPDQNLAPLIPYMMENFGDSVYIAAADYNYGHVAADVATEMIESRGGEVVGEEFIPLSVSDFTSTINRMNSEEPDWMMHFLVGGNHQNFFSQQHSAGLDLPIGSPMAFASTYDHLTIEAPAMSNVYGCSTYVEELPGDANQQHVEALKGGEPEIRYANAPHYNHWMAYRYYFDAVEEAGTTDQAEVMRVIESGDFTVDTPLGTTQTMSRVHSPSLDMYMFTANEDHELEIIDDFSGLEPSTLLEECEVGTDASTWDDPISEFLYD